jgi:hypothetical protein
MSAVFKIKDIVSNPDKANLLAFLYLLYEKGINYR